MTKHQLTTLLFSRGTPTVTIAGQTGIFSSILREDGSGSNFIVTLNQDGRAVSVFVKTID